MNEALDDFVGQQVRVTTVGASTRYTDIGVLESYAHPWLRLRTDSGKVLCLPVYNIRVVERA